jgi:allophanate hydrolase
MSVTVHTGDVTAAVTRAFERIADADRPEVWIELRSAEDALTEARDIEERVAAGDQLPLAGLTVAVKDNIDVAGLPTTAGCPEFAYTPECDAPAVARLRAAGAIVLGKTNLDQFATGLVGTRSPYGAVRDAHDPSRVAGGSSSGSAVAVALGMVDLALGTDTAGSGRVPAAFGGIVGFKPTRGLVSNRGVVPACRSFDCVSVLARSVAEAETAVELISAFDPGDPLSREPPGGAALRPAPARPRIGVAKPEQLTHLSPAFAEAYCQAQQRVAKTGAELHAIDLAPFLEAGELLYGGAFVAERYAAVGEFIAAHPEDVDPAVKQIILAARDTRAHDYVADRTRLDQLRLTADKILGEYDALLLPTAPFQPTLEQVTADPIELGRALGTFTSFANLLDLTAVAVPAGTADGGQFGVTLLAPAFHDATVATLARRFTDEPAPEHDREQVHRSEPILGVDETMRLLVVGAHMTGEPLNGELTSRGGRLIAEVRTAPSYRLYRLDTEPPKPGLVRMSASEHDAASIEGELWSLPPAGLAELVAALPPPMAIGPVTLEDGSQVSGFLCEPAAIDAAQDITKFRGWRHYVEM